MAGSHVDVALVNAVLASELTVRHLWVRYHALGGHHTRQELQRYLGGEVVWSQSDHDLLAAALRAEPQGRDVD